MTRKNLELKLETLLNEFKSEHGLSENEIYTIVVTISTLIYSDESTRRVWYKEMMRVSAMISEILRDKANTIMDQLNLSDEEKEKMMEKIKSKVKKNKKVEN